MELFAVGVRRLNMHFYKFGPFRIEATERLLRRGTEVVALPPKAVETLLALLKSKGQIVETDELLSKVWPGISVEPGSVTQNISLLRRVLGGGKNGTLYIDNIAKRGYRFVASVKEVREEFVEDSSLAVLPLENLSGNPKQDYFSDGMTDQLISSLMTIKGLRVCSRTTAMAYKSANKPLRQIAEELLVDWVVEGAVVQSGNRVRITAHLIEGAKEKQLWSQTYEKDMHDVLELQSELVEGIVGEIHRHLKLPGQVGRVASRQVDPEAFDTYLRGRHFWNKLTGEELRRAVGYFTRAIDLDPTYAPAHAGLADAYALLGSIGYDAMPPHEAMPLASAAANHALQIDSTLAEAHAALGYIKLSYDRDWPGAKLEFEQAIELQPNCGTSRMWYGHYLIAMARWEESATQLRRAVELDPLSIPCNLALGYAYYCARNFDRAIQQYRKTLEIAPEVPLAYYELSLAYGSKGCYQEAFAEAEKGYKFSGGAAAGAMLMGRANALLGRKPEAYAQLAKLHQTSKKKYVPAFYIAWLYADLGENDRAFEWFHKGCDERCSFAAYLNVEPSLDNLRADPRFNDLLRRVGFQFGPA